MPQKICPIYRFAIVGDPLRNIQPIINAPEFKKNVFLRPYLSIRNPDDKFPNIAANVGKLAIIKYLLVKTFNYIFKLKTIFSMNCSPNHEV